MLRPSPQDLLRGTCDQLEQQVLPELEAGAAQRQLKAALHLLRRLERSWDRLPAYLAEDNADIAATLGSFADGDPVATNLRLQEELIAADAEARDAHDEQRLAELRDLYRRMLDREAHAWGTS